MLQKGAIAGKMMGSQWFAYSKYRGDWQNLSVCKNLDDPIQFVRTRPFCVRIHQKPSRELPPATSAFLLGSSGHSGAKHWWRKNQVSDPEHGETSQLGVQGIVLPCWQTLWCDHGLVTCCDHWPVERDTLWSHDPLSSDQGLPWGDLCLTMAPLSVRGFKLTPVICHLATCHREHHVKQKPLKPRTRND